ncbi:hypothetical protein ABIB06_006527 [Bradyrhizobium sp. LB8.2]|uniref:hypothetical protein n=1 Tax=unclassified Bradyrhizobium TaxID=2631580 RepID=UPI003398F752
MKYLVPIGNRHVIRIVEKRGVAPHAVVVEKRKPRVDRRRIRQFQQNVLNTERDAQILRLARPAYWTAGGRQTFMLERLDVGKNGRVVGIFKSRYYNPVERVYFTDRFLFGVHNGAPKELKELPRVVG